MRKPMQIKLFNENIHRILNSLQYELYFSEPFDLELEGSDFKYTHLIISGSEASAAEDTIWSAELESLIRRFEANNKAILGICYGHQFLARTLSGKKSVYKLDRPEIGWSEVYPEKHPLFNEIYSPVVLQLHYDAVRNLNQDFTVIAHNETCIQAFQYQDKPVFGLQFHPEFDFKASEYFIDLFRKNDPKFHPYFKERNESQTNLLQNDLFIKNFLSY